MSSVNRNKLADGVCYALELHSSLYGFYTPLRSCLPFGIFIDKSSSFVTLYTELNLFSRYRIIVYI